MAEIKVTMIEEERIARMENQISEVRSLVSQLFGDKPNNGKRYLRDKQGAEYMCVSYRKFIQLRLDGFFPYSKHGRYVVTAQEDLDNFLLKHRLNTNK